MLSPPSQIKISKNSMADFISAWRVVVLNKSLVYKYNACYFSRDLVRFHRTFSLAERSQRYNISYNSSYGRGKKGWHFGLMHDVMHQLRGRMKRVSYLDHLHQTPSQLCRDVIRKRRFISWSFASNTATVVAWLIHWSIDCIVIGNAVSYLDHLHQNTSVSRLLLNEPKNTCSLLQVGFRVNQHAMPG